MSIERGSMVMVVRACSCCAADDPDLWLIFVVEAITPEMIAECKVCGASIHDRLVKHPSHDANPEEHGIPCSFLRKIEPGKESAADQLARLKRDAQHWVEQSSAERLALLPESSEG